LHLKKTVLNPIVAKYSANSTMPGTIPVLKLEKKYK
jgi:hypothetical protein